MIVCLSFSFLYIFYEPKKTTSSSPGISGIRSRSREFFCNRPRCRPAIKAWSPVRYNEGHSDLMWDRRRRMVILLDAIGKGIRIGKAFKGDYN